MSKKIVLNAVKDLVGELLYYGRKEDKELPVGVIDGMIKKGQLTTEEIVNQFREELVSQCSMLTWNVPRNRS